MKNKKLMLLLVVMLLVFSLMLVACDRNDTPAPEEDGEKPTESITWGEWKVTAVPTMTKEGELTRSNSVGGVETMTLPMLDKSKYTVTVVIQPTPNTYGVEKYSIKVGEQTIEFEVQNSRIVLSKVEEKLPTAESAGNYEYYLDDSGNKYVLESSGNYKKVSDDEVIIAIGNNVLKLYFNDEYVDRIIYKADTGIKYEDIVGVLYAEFGEDISFNSYETKTKNNELYQEDMVDYVVANQTSEVYFYRLYNVTIKNNIDDASEVISMEYGNKYIDYDFDSVYGYKILTAKDGVDDTANEVDLFNVIKAENHTIYLTCEPKTYKLRFETFGGTVIPEIDVKYGEKIVLPEPPTRADSEFLGWYYSKDYEDDAAFKEGDLMPAYNKTMYAKWRTNYDEGLKFSVTDTEALVTDYTGNNAEVVIPDTYDNLPVTYIEKYAFKDNATLTKVTLSTNITELGEEVFMNCPNLTTIINTDNIEYAGYSVFKGTALTEIDFPNLTKLSAYVFSELKGEVTSVNLPKVTSIEDMAFGKTRIKSLILPSVQTIKAKAFAEADIEEITLSSIKKIETAVFSDMSTLVKINLPEVTDVKMGLANNCASLEEVYLPKLTTYSDLLIKDAPKLRMLNIDSLREYNYMLLANCPNVEYIEMRGKFELSCAIFSNVTIDTFKFYTEAGSRINPSALKGLKVNNLYTNTNDLKYCIVNMTSLSTLNITEGKLYSGIISNIPGLTKLVIGDALTYAESQVLSGYNGPVYLMHTTRPAGFDDNWINTMDKAMLYSESEPTLDMWATFEGYWHGDINNPIAWERPCERGFVFEDIDDKTTALVKYYNVKENVVIPATYKGKAVTTIKSGAFAAANMPASKASFVKTIEMPSITKIESNAIAFDKLDSVVIGDIVNVGEKAFGTTNIGKLEVKGDTPFSGNNAMLGASVNEAVVTSTKTAILSGAAQCDKVTVVGDKLVKDSIYDITNDTDIFVDTTVTSAEVGAVSAGTKANIYLKATEMPVGFVDGWNAGDGMAYLYSENEPTGEMWATGNNYWSFDNVGVALWPLNFTRGLLFAKVGNDYVVSDYVGSATRVEIPNTYGTNAKVIGIGDNAFADTAVEEVQLGANIASIGANAFKNTASLSKIVGIESVTSIGANAFENTLLQTFNLNSVSTLGANAFNNCSNIIVFMDTDDNANIDANAFAGASIKVANVHGALVDYIAKATACDTINVHGTALRAGDISVNDTNAKIFIYESVISAEVGSVVAGSNFNVYFKAGVLPEGFVSGWFAGTGKAYLYSKYEPTAEQWMASDNYWHFADDGATIEIWTINHTKGLKFEKVDGGYIVSEYIGEDVDVEIPKVYGGVPVIGIKTDAFKNNANITSVKIGDKLVTIGDGAFEGCTNLGSIVGIEIVTNIGARALKGTAIKSLTLDAIASIGANAFEGVALDTIALSVADATKVDVNALTGLRLGSATISANIASRLATATTCPTITITGDIMEANTIVAVPNNTTIIISDSVKGAKPGAIASDVTASIYFMVSALPVDFEPGYNASTVVPSLFSATEPTPEMWAEQESYWYMDGKDRINWICGYTKGLLFTADADGNYGVSGYKGKSTGVAIPDTLNGKNVVAINDNAFRNNSAIEFVILGANVTSLGANAFFGSEALSTVNNVANVTTFGDSAFANSGITSFVHPTLTSVSANMFGNCKSLATVDLPSATTIGNGAFINCSALTTLNLPKAQTIGEKALSEIGLTGTLELPEALTLANGVFMFNNTLSEVIAPKLTSIGSYCFARGKSIERVNLGKVKVIPNRAFYFAENISEIIAPEVEEVNDPFESSSTKVDKLVFNTPKIRIINGMSGAKIESIDLTNVTTIGDRAFENCVALTTVTGYNLPTITPHTFGNCSSLVSVEIAPTTTTIEQYAFEHCPKLTTIDLTNVSSIGDSAFLNTGFVEFSAPALTGEIGTIFGHIRQDPKMAPNLVTFTAANATIISGGALQTLPNLATVNLPNVVEARDGAFSNCPKLVNYTIPKLAKVGDGLFENSGIEGFVLPDNMPFERLSWNMFRGSGIKRLSLPNITEINDFYVFYECKLLEYLNLPKLHTCTQQTFYKTDIAELCLGADIVNYVGDMFTHTNIGTLKIGDIGEGGTASRIFGTQVYIDVLEANIKDVNVFGSAPITRFIPRGTTLTTNVIGRNIRDVIIKKTFTTAEANAISYQDTHKIYMEHTAAEIPVGFNADWNATRWAVTYLYSATRKTSATDPLPNAHYEGYWHYDTDGKTPVIWK